MDHYDNERPAKPAGSSGPKYNGPEATSPSRKTPTAEADHANPMRGLAACADPTATKDSPTWARGTSASKSHATAQRPGAATSATQVSSASKRGGSASKHAAAKQSSATKQAPRVMGRTRAGMHRGQFVHEACFAMERGNATPTKNGGTRGPKKADARSVLGEIAREPDRPDFWRHLTNQGLKPQPPVTIAGVPAEELKHWWAAFKKQKVLPRMLKKRDAKRMGLTPMLPNVRVRADGKEIREAQKKHETVLGTCIASWPIEGDFESMRFKKWVRRTLRYMQRRYGDNLVGVYLHVDEHQPHLHAVFHNNGANVKELMTTHSAATAVLAEGGARAEAKAALKYAGQVMQNVYQDMVGRWVGLFRKGPNPQGRKSWWDAVVQRAARKMAIDLTDEERAKAAKAEIARQEAEDRQRGEVSKRVREARAFTEQLRDWVFQGILTREQAAEAARKYQAASADLAVQAVPAPVGGMRP